MARNARGEGSVRQLPDGSWECVIQSKYFNPKPAILRTYRDSVNMENYNLLNGDEPITSEKTYVLENADSFFSIGLLAYPGVLEKVAEILDDDFYFYAKNPSYIYISAKNENYDGSLVKLPRKWNPLVYWEDAFSPLVHEYHRESGEITW